MSENQDNEAQFRKAVFPTLKGRYGEHFQTFLALCSKVKKIEPNDHVDFLYELDQAIGGYKLRIDDPDYFVRMAECQSNFAKAAEALDAALGGLGHLDGPHWHSLLASLEVFTPPKLLEELATSGLTELLNTLRRASVLSASLSIGLMAAGDLHIQDAQKRDRGNARLPYLFPTVELIRFWKKWTGKDVPYAKATPAREDISGGRLEQASTEFIRLALSYLDPTVTTANAVTSVNNARNFLREAKEDPAQLPDGTSLFQYLRTELGLSTDSPSKLNPRSSDE